MPLSFRYQVSALDYIDKALSAEEFESRIETALLYANSQDSKSLAEDCFYFKSKICPISSILLKRFTISKRRPNLIMSFSIPRRTDWNLQRVWRRFLSRSLVSCSATALFSSILQMWCIWIRKKNCFSFPMGEAV